MICQKARGVRLPNLAVFPPNSEKYQIHSFRSTGWAMSYLMYCHDFELRVEWKMNGSRHKCTHSLALGLGLYPRSFSVND